MLEAARAALPELPAARARATSASSASRRTRRALFAFEPEWGDYFEPRSAGEPGTVANWVTELRARADAPAAVDAGRAGQARRPRRGPGPSRPATRRASSTAWSPTAATRPEIVAREDLGAMGDSGELAGIVAEVIDENPDVVERIRGGNTKAMGALVGPGHARDQGQGGRRRGQPPDPRAARRVAGAPRRDARAVRGAAAS